MINEGVTFYNKIGLVFVSCGVISLLLLGFVSTMPQDYEKYNVSLYMTVWFIISIILMIIGIVLIILGKYSTKYQRWINKEVKSYLSHRKSH